MINSSTKERRTSMLDDDDDATQIFPANYSDSVTATITTELPCSQRNMFMHD